MQNTYFYHIFDTLSLIVYQILKSFRKIIFHFVLEGQNVFLILFCRVQNKNIFTRSKFECGSNLYHTDFSLCRKRQKRTCRIALFSLALGQSKSYTRTNRCFSENVIQRVRKYVVQTLSQFFLFLKTLKQFFNWKPTRWEQFTSPTLIFSYLWREWS